MNGFRKRHTMSGNQSFSQRMGYVPQKAIQIEAVDLPLKQLLWHECYEWLNVAMRSAYMEHNAADLYRHVWVEFFGESYDTFEPLVKRKYDTWDGPRNPRSAFLVEYIRQFFFDEKTPWYRLFDLIQFLLTLPVDDERNRGITVVNLNARLYQGKSAYRVVNGQFVPITNRAELAAVEKATEPSASALRPVSIHLQQAMNLLADRTAPDYRNSMKESISAVESLCKLVAKMPGGTLGQMLEKTAKELDLNDHLRDGLKLIYKYTSDDHGIRHGLKDERHPGRECAVLAHHLFGVRELRNREGEETREVANLTPGPSSAVSCV